MDFPRRAYRQFEFIVVINEGSDEFWESINEENIDTINELRDCIVDALEQYGFHYETDFYVSDGVSIPQQQIGRGGESDAGGRIDTGLGMAN